MAGEGPDNEEREQVRTGHLDFKVTAVEGETAGAGDARKGDGIVADGHDRFEDTIAVGIETPLVGGRFLDAGAVLDRALRTGGVRITVAIGVSDEPDHPDTEVQGTAVIGNDTPCLVESVHEICADSLDESRVAGHDLGVGDNNIALGVLNIEAAAFPALGEKLGILDEVSEISVDGGRRLRVYRLRAHEC
jgi:hypothetical protein